MARSDLLRNLDPATSADVPCVVVVQHERFDPLATRLVVPLMSPATVPKPLTRLNPQFEIEGRPLVLVVQETVGVPRRALGPVIGSLASHGPAILGALDFLVSG